MKAHFCFRLFAHAFVLQLALLLLASMAPLCAQPVLQEWWRAPENMTVGQEITYLPNFYQGKGAMAIMYNGRGVTWLNKYPGDTNNIFSWKGGLPIYTGDLDGDGVQDYVDGSGYVYKGQGNGQLPKMVTVLSLPSLDYGYTLITDINKDGKQDVLFVGERSGVKIKFAVMLGKSPLDSLRTQELNAGIPYQGSEEDYEAPALYNGPDSLPRIVIYRTRRFMNTPIDNFLLYRAFWAKDSSEPVFDMVDEIRGNDTKRLFTGDIYTYKNGDRQTTGLFVRNYESTKLYCFQNNGRSLRLVWTLATIGKDLYFEPPFGCLNHSLDGDEHPEWYYSIYDKKLGTVTTYVCKGGIIPDSTAQCIITRSCYEELTSIDDINNDSIADIITGSSPYSSIPNCTSIFLGPGIINSSGADASDRNILNLDDPAPHPVIQGSKVHLRADKAGNYTLQIRDLQGRQQSVPFQGFLPAGEHFLPLSLHDITHGVYQLVVLNADNQIIGSRTIIIE
jgi:hypothetical protein